MKKKVHQKSAARNTPAGAPSPFASGGFSFDPKSISVLTSSTGAKEKRPGDVFGADELAASRANFNRTKFVGIIRRARYHRSFRNQGLTIFLYFVGPGVLVALLVFLGLI